MMSRKTKQNIEMQIDAGIGYQEVYNMYIFSISYVTSYHPKSFSVRDTLLIFPNFLSN